MNPQPEVVLVDDEEMVLTSVSALLMLETECNVHTFLSPAEAIRHLETHPVDLVVSDYLMPQMNGIQLLAKSKELQPEAARVLLTGHADKASAIQAINAVGLYHYLEKPWENAQLLMIVASAVERTQLLRQVQGMLSDLDNAHDSLKDIQTRLIKAFL
ncbi:MAG: response regulator [Acidobacteria bacterium]|nr:response regulator [Acidobacteriota bacterium]